MKALEQLSNITIAQLRELYQLNQMTPLQVMEQLIERAEQDASYNIWITAPSMELIAPYLDGLQSKSKDLPLWGIPFAVKDNIDVAGMPTTAGCEAYSYVPTEHATVVSLLIEAGAIPVGKTNLDQFATGLVGTRSPYGICKNAFDPSLISGGSSSGSAVAVARGQVPFALGTDTAGSGRVPAALNELIGFKPSVGAWSTKGVVPACASLDCVTVFAQTYEEVLIVDRLLRQEDIDNAWSRQLPEQQWTLPKKIIFLEEEPVFFGSFAAQFRQGWQQAIAQIKQLGIEVDYIDGAYLQEAAQILYEGPFVAERWAGLSEFVEAHPDDIYPVTDKVLRQAQNPAYTASALFQAQHKMRAYKKRIERDLKEAVLIMPTVGGTWTIQEVERDPIATNSQLGLYTNHCNILDLCAINVPVVGERPFGVTLFANAGQEHLLHRLAELFLQQTFVEQVVETTTIAACGLHLKGYPLEQQMLSFGATYKETIRTAPSYQFIKIEDGLTRPGLLYNEEVGAAIEVDLWDMPSQQLAAFAQCIKAPLALGKITLADEREVLGFVCAADPSDYEDITETGGWRYVD